jgi:hypothetical protein
LSWLEATGQRWKLHIFFGLMSVTFILVFALALSFGTGDGTLPIVLGIAAATCAVVAHLWVAFSVRCPNCHRQIGWLVLSIMGTSRWLAQLWRGEVCPSCGDTPAADRAANAE